MALAMSNSATTARRSARCVSKLVQKTRPARSHALCELLHCVNGATDGTISGVSGEWRQLRLIKGGQSHAHAFRRDTFSGTTTHAAKHRHSLRLANSLACRHSTPQLHGPRPRSFSTPRSPHMPSLWAVLRQSNIALAVNSANAWLSRSATITRALPLIRHLSGGAALPRPDGHVDTIRREHLHGRTTVNGGTCW